MKTNLRSLGLTLFSGAFLVAAYPDKVRLEELPLELRDKIQIYTGANPIEDIDRQTRDGRTTYEVAFKENGQHKELLFDDKGRLLTQDGLPALRSGKITFQELPVAVKHIVETRVSSVMINDIDRQVKNGEITYEIGFKQAGRQQELVVSHDGRILSDAPSAIGAPGGAVTGAGQAAEPQSLWQKPAPLSSSQRIQFSEIPAPVAKSILTASKGARIEQIERGLWRGREIYKATFMDSGKRVEIQVREDGRMAYDPRAGAMGRPAAAVTGRGSSLYPNVTSAVQLSAAEKIDRRSVPAAVERTLMRETAGASIEEIERGAWQGRTVYEIAFKQNDQHVELQVDENGNIVFDPRTTQD